MQREDPNFHLIDLASQAYAVERLLTGRPIEQKLAWLAERGELSLANAANERIPDTYLFQSRLGFKIVFFLRDDRFVFMGDNTTWVASEPAVRGGEPVERLDYRGRVDQAVTFELRTLLRYSAVLAPALALLWALNLRSHVVLSKDGVVSGNPAGMILSIAKNSAADNWDLAPYTHRALALGFHRVDWSRWTRNGRYLLIPKWVPVTLTSVASVVTIVIVLRRREAAIAAR